MYDSDESFRLNEMVEIVGIYTNDDDVSTHSHVYEAILLGEKLDFN